MLNNKNSEIIDKLSLNSEQTNEINTLIFNNEFRGEVKYEGQIQEGKANGIGMCL